MLNSNNQQAEHQMLFVYCIAFFLLFTVSTVFALKYESVDTAVQEPEPPAATQESKTVTDPLVLAALQGEAWAQYQLGIAFISGIDRRKDPEEGVLWLKKAANQNHSEAQFELGTIYSQGKDVQRDYLNAYYWISRAELSGNALARARKQKLAPEVSGADRARLDHRARSDHAAQTGQ